MSPLYRLLYRQALDQAPSSLSKTRFASVLTRLRDPRVARRGADVRVPEEFLKGGQATTGVEPAHGAGVAAAVRVEVLDPGGAPRSLKCAHGTNHPKSADVCNVTPVSLDERLEGQPRPSTRGPL